MNDEELKRRLRAAMDSRTADLRPQLSGPELRRRAERRATPGERVRRAAPMLASAAAVAGVAVAVALIATGGDSPAPAPVQPGGGRPVSTDTSVPAPSSSQRPSATTTPGVPGRPSEEPSTSVTELTVPVRSGTRTVVLRPSRVTSLPSGRPTPTGPTGPTGRPAASTSPVTR